MTSIKITSPQNPRIKQLVALQQKSQLRRQENLIVVEGVRELRHCINAGFKVQSVYYCPTLITIDQLPTAADEAIEVTRDVYDKIAYRGSTEGVIATVVPR